MINPGKFVKTNIINIAIILRKLFKNPMKSYNHLSEWKIRDKNGRNATNKKISRVHNVLRLPVMDRDDD